MFSDFGPLASRMRPRTLEEVLGQERALEAGSPLQVLAKPFDGSSFRSSIILWGPPGTGKTTIAKAVANTSGRRFIELSAVSSGVKELREVIDRSRTDQEIYGVATIVFLDEIHRFSKAQQDALLPAVEAGWIVLIAATTENPSFSVISPLLSRSLTVRLLPLGKPSILKLLESAVIDPRGLGGGQSIAEAAKGQIADLAGGDARKALTILEAASSRATALGRTIIELEDVNASLEAAMVRYDREGEGHYDTISAFIKSVRGSDADAAIHYLARMLEGGEDPRFIARRLVILAAEDIGLADPNALPLAVAAFEAVNLVGMPEGRIPLAETTIYLALAPKSNSSYLAIDRAIAEVRAGFQPQIPLYLRGSLLARSGSQDSYRYPHDESIGVIRQEYLSEPRDYFDPKPTGYERELRERLTKIRAIVRGEGA